MLSNDDQLVKGYIIISLTNQKLVYVVTANKMCNGYTRKVFTFAEDVTEMFFLFFQFSLMCFFSFVRSAS